MKKLLFAALLMTLPFTAAKAEPVSYGFDTVHSQIIFFINHLGYSNSEGEFQEFDGTIVFDPENIKASSVNVVIDTASIDLDDDEWNTHLKSADFFNVEKYPHMTFKSTAIEQTGEDTAVMTGDLTLLGVTKPVTLDVTLNKVGTDRNGLPHAGFSAVGTLKRSDFGMTYGLPMVGDEVELRIEVEAETKTAPKPEE